ncbi:MAG: hypothetical protein ABEI58_00055 [Candidatus Nanohaloarchaea archaeon]
MERKTLVMGAAVFFVVAMVGFYAAFTAQGPKGDAKYSQRFNLTADDGNDVVTASFDGRSLDLMHESTERAKFYIDQDRDGSFDIRLDGLTHDGSVNNETRIVTYNNTDYRLYFRYSDSLDSSGDAWLRLFFVEEL